MSLNHNLQRIRNYYKIYAINIIVFSLLFTNDGLGAPHHDARVLQAQLRDERAQEWQHHDERDRQWQHRDGRDLR